MAIVPNPCSLLFPYTMDELAPAERAQFECHLTGCSTCQLKHAELQDLRQAVEADLAQAPASPVMGVHRSLLSLRQAGLGLAALAFALVAFLPQSDAFADRLHRTASHLHAGVTHQMESFDIAAYRLYHKTRVHLHLRNY